MSLVTTKGFGDVLEIARTQYPDTQSAGGRPPALRGRVTWHDSDRFDGTVRARVSAEMPRLSGARWR